MALGRNRSMGRSPRSAGGALAFAAFVVSASTPKGFSKDCHVFRVNRGTLS